MRTSPLFFVLVLSAPLLTAPADADPEKGGAIDVSAAREKMLLLSDGKSHYLAVLPVHLKRALDFDFPVFYGDGKRFFAVPTQGYSANGDARWDYSLVEPRLAVGGRAEGSAYLIMDNGKFRVECGTRKTELSVVEGKEAQALLAAASFERSPRRYRPYALARDDRGNYYYVDRGTTPETEKQFRLFAGQKGNLKKQKMTNIVSDSEGDVFSTKTGSLRLILGRNQASWVEKEQPRQLTFVPIDFNANVAMIYNELGVYVGERLGRPCDDM